MRMESWTKAGQLAGCIRRRRKGARWGSGGPANSRLLAAHSQDLTACGELKDETLTKKEPIVEMVLRVGIQRNGIVGPVCQ